MTLKQAIQRVANWKTLSAQDLLDALTADDYQPKDAEDCVWSIAGISRVFGAEIGEAVYGGMLAASLNGLAARYASVGLDATNDQWLDFADQLSAVEPLASLPAATKESLKRIGFVNKKLWADPVTLQEVTDARQEAIDDARLINALSLFNDRMIVGGDAAAIWSQAWTDAGA